jgi:hypothetical protein
MKSKDQRHWITEMQGRTITAALNMLIDFFEKNGKPEWQLELFPSRSGRKYHLTMEDITDDNSEAES